jgi:hypothetical protein
MALGAADPRPALRIVATAPFNEARVSREGRELVVSLGATAPQQLVLPPASPPIESLRLERVEGGVAFRVVVAPEVPFEIRRDGLLLVVVFGEATSAPSRTPDVPTQYPLLFPAGPPAPEVAPHAAATEAPRNPFELRLGPLRLRPSLVVTYVNADVASFDSGLPVHDRYLQVQPGLGTNIPMSLGLSLWDGRLRVSYEPRFRGFSSFEEILTPTHVLTAGLNLPIGQRVQFGLGYRYVNGLLETTEVDPGREYFYRLGKFRRDEYSGQLRWAMGPRLQLELEGGYEKVDMQQPANFFSYERGHGRGAFNYDLTASTRTTVGYLFEWVPQNPERPVVEGNSQGPYVALTADPTPRLNLMAELGYRRRENPLAPPEAKTYDTYVFSAQARQMIGSEASLTLRGARDLDLSAYEQNPFYVSTRAEAVLAVPLPAEFTLNGSAGWIWNRYVVPVASIGEPRRDTIFGWSAGLGRPFNTWAFVRADYRWERRDSNVPGFNITTHAITATVGVGFFGEPVKP